MQVDQLTNEQWWELGRGTGLSFRRPRRNSEDLCAGEENGLRIEYVPDEEGERI